MSWRDYDRFDIHTSVHPNIIPNYSQQEATFFLIYLFLQTLFMFQAVPPPIIRSTLLYIQLQVLSTNTAVLVDNTGRCMYNYVLLIMGGETA